MRYESISEWAIRDTKDKYIMQFGIHQVEVLRRRNKRIERCISDDVNYDQKMIDDLLDGIRCKAPYQNPTKDLSICSSKKSMKQTMFNISSSPHFLKPACTSIENINYRYSEMDVKDKEDYKDMFWLGLKYPDKFKDIHQVRAVDIQTVIGNAGGYVGLFLGS